MPLVESLIIFLSENLKYFSVKTENVYNIAVWLLPIGINVPQRKMK